MLRISLIGILLVSSIVKAQPPLVPLYTVAHINLPTAMDNQVCISGIKFMEGKLYFASERCPLIFSSDLNGTKLESKAISPGQEFEMEGLTSFRSKLYTVSENIAAVYELDITTGKTVIVPTSQPLPPKSKSGDGMEGIAANEDNNKFYLLRERNENMSHSQLLTYNVQANADGKGFTLQYESMIELPLQSPQWRYSDICYDKVNDRLLCLKSFSKGKLRQQYVESVDIDKTGNLVAGSLKDIPVENFSGISNEYKDRDYSMNLEGITVDSEGNIYVVSDNTSGKAQCDRPAKEKTILLKLVKK